MGHVVLLGDSIFDNAVYVPGYPSVAEQCRVALDEDWETTLLAVDGAICTDVHEQMDSLPDTATHLVLSVGGNDALLVSDILHDSTLPASELLEALSGIYVRFQRHYRDLLSRIVDRGLPTTVCTIYTAVPKLLPREVMGLALFNDGILLNAVQFGCPVVDLRWICVESKDYSPLSPIEPSHHGGAKIAHWIAKIMSSHDFGDRRCVLYGRESDISGRIFAGDAF